MAIQSSIVVAGNDILASEYNNLRADLLTNDIAIAGVKTFSSKPVFSAGITISDDSGIATLKKFNLGANNWIIESSSNIVKHFVGNNEVLQLGSGPSLTVQGNLSVPPASKISLDASIGNDYITRSGAGTIDIYTNGSIGLEIAAVTVAIGTARDLQLFSGKKLSWDTGGDTYTKESSANVLDTYTGGSLALRLDASQNATIGGTLATGGSVTTPAGVHGYQWGDSNTRFVPHSTQGKLELYLGNILKYEFWGGAVGAKADIGWFTFSPDIRKSEKYKNKAEVTPKDFLDWAMEDAGKPVKPYTGIPRKKNNSSDNHPSAFATDAEVDSEVAKYEKDVSKIAIGIARWADRAEQRILALEQK